jgi:hypothetical protein
MEKIEMNKMNKKLVFLKSMLENLKKYYDIDDHIKFIKIY